MTVFRLPDVGEGLESAEIVEWLIHEGDTVTRDQPLVEILTDKSQTQLPSPQAGTVTRLGFSEGDIAGVGEVLVEFAGDEVDEPVATSTAPRAIADPAGAAPPADRTPPPSRPKAAPAVRRRALDMGLDLPTITGTGPGGRITQADLDRDASATPIRAGDRAPSATSTPQLSAERIGWMAPGAHPLRGIRRVTAEAMARSWQIPHIHTSDEADATELLAARTRIQTRHPEAAEFLTPLSFFVMAVANGLRRFPVLNASIDESSITIHEEVNIGIAVASNEGLSVPVIRRADQHSLFDLAAEIRRLSTRVRDRSVTVEDLRGGTATISNYGSMGGRFAAPIIRAPEVVIVGFGSIRPRPFVVDGHVVARPTLPVSIAGDHRLVDGDVMTAFGEYVITQLSDPVTLLAR
jgi:pyruvate dehydrogenase E2 component (dihydrolipoamide acetyltransferase)